MDTQHNTHEAVILSAVRTPMGRYQGALSGLSATQLGAVAVQAAVERSGIDPQRIDEVLMGNVVSAGVGQAPARQAALFGGLPDTVPASTINKVCGSGLKACMLGAQAIRAGDADLIVAGGMESMSNAPHLLQARSGLRFGDQQLEDSLLHDGLLDPFENWVMGMAAEYIAEKHEVTREAMDRWALRSHDKAITAMDAGKFKDELVSLPVPSKNGKVLVQEDETPRRDTSLEKLASLKPAFTPDGRVTAGNAPGLNDGASAIVLASRRAAQEMGIRPMARVLAYSQAAVPPKELFIAPARALPRLLQKLGWRFADVDLVELNEAFAAQVLADGYAMLEDGWDWDWEKVNVHGGAIALGHPVGATGAKLIATANSSPRWASAVVSTCIGGGQGVAVVLQRVA